MWGLEVEEFSAKWNGSHAGIVNEQTKILIKFKFHPLAFISL